MATVLPDSVVPEEAERPETNGNDRPPSTHSDGERRFLKRKQSFLVRLGAALMSAGSPTYDLGRTLKALAVHLDLGAAEFSVFPNTLLAAFRQVDKTRAEPPPVPGMSISQRVRFMSSASTIDEAQQLLAARATEQTEVLMVTFDASPDLSKLSMLADLAAKLLTDQLDLEQAEEVLIEVETIRRGFVWKAIDTLLAFPLFAIVASVLFFGGNALSMLLVLPPAFLISAFAHSPFTLPLLSRDISNLTPFISGLIASFSARLFNSLFETQCYPTLVLSPIARILPGTDVLFAFIEIATGDIVTGSSRLASAAIHVLLVTFGIALGSTLCFWVPHYGDDCTPSGEPGGYAFLAIAAAFAEIVMNKGEGLTRRTWTVTIAVAGIGYAVYLIASNTTSDYGERMGIWCLLVIFCTSRTDQVPHSQPRRPSSAPLPSPPSPTPTPASVSPLPPSL